MAHADSLLKSIDLYWAVYARMWDAIRYVETWKRPGALRVYRAAEDDAKGRRLTVEQCRTPYQSTIRDYRWTGPRPDWARRPRQSPQLEPRMAAFFAKNPPAAGGVYTAVAVNDATLGELTWYTRDRSGTRVSLDNDVRRKLAGQPPLLDAASLRAKLLKTEIAEFEVDAGAKIANLALDDGSGSALLRALVEDVDGAAAHSPDPGEKGRIDAVVQALRTRGFASIEAAYAASRDYCVPRAIAQAVRDLLPGYAGVRVTSSRSDAGRVFREDSGQNVVFFGKDGEKIAALHPVALLEFEARGAGGVQGRTSNV